MTTTEIGRQSSSRRAPVGIGSGAESGLRSDISGLWRLVVKGRSSDWGARVKAEYWLPPPEPARSGWFGVMSRRGERARVE